jgi:hypothetical protein
MVDLFVTPSIIQQFYLKPEWGVKAYYNTIYGKFGESNYFIRRGVNLHNKLGYDNNRRFFGTKVIDIDGQEYVVALEGTPDHLNPLKELKTCGAKTPETIEKNIQAAALQLKGYMYLTGEEYGYVVFVNRKTEDEVAEVFVPRNDEEFFYWVKKFFKYLWSQPKLQDYTTDQNTFKPASETVHYVHDGRNGNGKINEGFA